MSKVQEFLKSLEQPTTTDAVLEILKKMPLPMRGYAIHDYIHKHHPELEQELRFNLSGIYPYSRKLERILFRLSWADKLGVGFDGYFIS